MKTIIHETFLKRERNSVEKLTKSKYDAANLERIIRDPVYGLGEVADMKLKDIRKTE